MESKSSSQTATIKIVENSIPLNLANSEAGDIVKKAIYFSGRWKNWANKKTLTYTKKMQSFDSLGNQLRDASQLHQYQLRPTFKASINWEENGTTYQIINNGNQVWKLKNGKIMRGNENVNSAWNSSFVSHYVMCMPFKLADPGAILTYEGIDTLANKQIVHSIKVVYEKGAGTAGGMHTWWYYFDKDTYKPEANLLDYGDGYSYTQYNSFAEINGIKINRIRMSYKSNPNRDLRYLSTIYINEDIRFNDNFDEGIFQVKE
jgi:hypothetical protein